MHTSATCRRESFQYDSGVWVKSLGNTTMGDDKDEVDVNPDAVDDLLEGDWKDDDEEGDKLFGDDEEEEV
jgi:hypothetical protein